MIGYNALRLILEYVQVALEVVDGVALCVGRADDNLIRLEATHETVCRLIVAAEEFRKAIDCYARLGVEYPYGALRECYIRHPADLHLHVVAQGEYALEFLASRSCGFRHRIKEEQYPASKVVRASDARKRLVVFFAVSLQYGGDV